MEQDKSCITQIVIEKRGEKKGKKKEKIWLWSVFSDDNDYDDIYNNQYNRKTTNKTCVKRLDRKYKICRDISILATLEGNDASRREIN